MDSGSMSGDTITISAADGMLMLEALVSYATKHLTAAADAHEAGEAELRSSNLAKAEKIFEASGRLQESLG